MLQSDNVIFSLGNEKAFSEAAMDLYKVQLENNTVYRNFIGLLHAKKAVSIHKIPFLPVQFFKGHEVLTSENNAEENDRVVFTSSGTTGQITSKHIVSNIGLYEESFLRAFELFYGKPEEYCFLFLLPSYLERSGSSLVYMAQKLVELSKHNGSDFFLHNLNELKLRLQQRKQQHQKTFLFGVSYALLDLAEMGIELNDRFIVMETGGMKGKRKEMVKEEFHAELKRKFSVNTIHSEYGMTELLSQAYSPGDGIFRCPPWMKVFVRDPYDYFQLLEPGRTGCLNIIDLANKNSCAFIATQDLGRVYEDGSFEVVGRLDNSELRGCNLMLD